MECTYKDEKPTESKDEAMPPNPKENELPLADDIISNGCLLFPRVEVMKLRLFDVNKTFITLPLVFFEKYLSNTKCLTEIQMNLPYDSLNDGTLLLFLLLSRWKKNNSRK